MKNSNFKPALLGGVMSLATFVAGPAWAAQDQPADAPAQAEAQTESGFGEILVTARRREESIQSVPVSVVALNPEAIARAPTTNVSALAQIVPGLSVFAPSDPNNYYYGIRGQTFTFGTLFPPILTYFAEIPMQRVGSGSFLDLANVQVLKGPQGTLFGRVTDGGAIVLTPQKPVNRFEGFAEVTVGNYDRRSLQAVLNVPIVDDRVLLRVAGEINRRDGYTLNLLNGKRLDDEHYEVVRASLTLRPTDWLENTTIVNYNHADQNGNSFVLTGVNPITVTAAGNAATLPSMLAQLAAQQARGPRKVVEGDNTGLTLGKDAIFYRRKVLTVVNTTVVDLADNIKLKNIFGYVFNREDSGIAAGYAPAYYMASNVFLPRYDQYYRQYSNETQLQGSLFDNVVDFTTGLYFDRQTIPGPAEQLYFLYGRLQLSQQQYPVTTEAAVYGQVGIKLAEGLKLNGGLRYTKDKVKADIASYISFTTNPFAIPHGQCLRTNAGFPQAIVSLPCTRVKTSSNPVTYTVGLDYQVTPDIFLYISRRKGYRPGGFNVTSNPAVASYKPEYNVSNEIGIKADWTLDGMKLRTNVAAFRDRYSDIQAQLSIQPPGGGAPFNALTNVSSGAIIKGVDVEAALIPVTGLQFSVGYTYLDAHYSKKGLSQAYLDAACSPDPQTRPVPDPTKFCARFPLKVAPKHTLNVGARYTVPVSSDRGEVSIGGNMYYTSRTYQSGDPIKGTAPAYTLFNADLAWNSVGGSSFDAKLFVNNLTDKTYQASITNFTNVGNQGISAAFYGLPRMYGASLRYRFGN